MVDFRRVLQDYRYSGALQSLVSVQSALGNGIFLDKRGELLAILRFHGQDSDCLDASQLDSIHRRFESVLRCFDERFRIYQYLFKTQSPSLPAEHHSQPVLAEAIRNRIEYLTSRSQALYSFETYVAVVYEGWRPANTWKHQVGSFLSTGDGAVRDIFSTRQTLRRLADEIEVSRELFAHKVASFATQCRDFAALEVLDDQQAFRFFRRLLNYAPFKQDGVRLKYPSFVDFQACDSALECHRDFLRLDDDYVQALTLKIPPAQTFAQMLKALREIPSDCIVVTEWKPQSSLKMRKLIQQKRRHFHNSKASFLNYLHSERPAAHDVLVDDSAAASVDNLGACLEEIGLQGRSFGEFSLTLVLYAREVAALRQSVAHSFKIFASLDAQLIEERCNRLNAWLAVQPGNSVFNFRRFWLLDANYADLSLLFMPSHGEIRNPRLESEYLAILEGRGRTPYFFNFHCDDIAHTLVLGATGSGKSFLLNFFLTHVQKYAPNIYIFDLGGSYETLTRLLGGGYFPIGVEKRAFTIGPFSLPLTPENHLFLFAFVKVLIESSGYRLTAEDERDLYEQIENLYSVPPDQRRLSTLYAIVRRNLRGPLQKWVQGGPYGGLFDNVEDTLTLSRFQTFDFEGMDKAVDQLEPLLFYILHRANAAVSGAGRVFKLFVMDEAWRFFRHPVIKAYIVEALKTWRKKNAGIVLATQSGEDLLASELLPTIVESCLTKLFLANPGMDQAAYQRAFHLNETEAATIASLIPKQEMLLKRPQGSRVLTLNVDRKGYWLYTNNPKDNALKREAFERHGFERGLESLVKENP